nr:hypothetical protein [Limosilactobacillus kribbianus]
MRELGCQITATTADRQAITVDQTIIYPGGGGQPHDQARLLINEDWYRVVATAINKSASSFFVVVYSSSVLPGMVPWFVILISELKFRRQNPQIMQNHPFKLPLYPYANYFSITLLIIILIFMFINPDTRISVSIGVVFLIVISTLYWVRYGRKAVQKS